MKTLLLILSPIVIQAIVFKKFLGQVSYSVAIALSLCCNILSYIAIVTSIFICFAKSSSPIIPFTVVLCVNLAFYMIALLIIKILLGYPLNEAYLPILIGYGITTATMVIGLFLNN